MRGSVFLLLCCVWWMLPAHGTGLAEHQRRLDQADRLLSQAERHPDQADDYARQASTLVPSESCPALQQATEHPNASNLAQARRQLGTLKRAATLPPAPSGVTTATARDALNKVLNSGEYGSLKKAKVPKGVAGFMTRFWRGMEKFFKAIGKQLERFFNWLERIMPKFRPMKPVKAPWLKGMSVGLKYLLIGLAIVLALFLLGFIGSKLFARWHRRRAPEVRADLADKPQNITRKGEPSFWERSLLQAEELWQAGNQREALRILHRACLVLLDARGILRYDETRANGEVLRELRRQGHAGVQEALSPIMRSFDRSWYGFLNLSGDEFSVAIDSSRRFRAAVVEEG